MVFRALALLASLALGCSSSSGSSSGTGGGGGPTGQGGVGTFASPGFANHRLAVDAAGNTHLAFNEGASASVRYGVCASRCNDPAAWGAVELTSSASLGVVTVGLSGFGADAQGRLHVVLSNVPPSGRSTNALVYGTCAGSCVDAGAWSWLDLSSVAQGRNAIGTNDGVVVEASGRVTIATQGVAGSNPSRVLTCSANCSAASGWAAGNAIDGNPLHVVADGAGVLHAMVHRGTAATGENLLHYGRCASRCTNAANWQLSPLGFLMTRNLWATAMAVSPSGRAFMAYNQGRIAQASSANDKLVVTSCAGSSCADLGTWSSFEFSTADLGEDGASLEAIGDGVLLGATDGARLVLHACDSGCEAASAWSEASTIDASDAISSAIQADTATACEGIAESAAWWPYRPRTALTPSGGVVVVHAPYGIVKCPRVSSPLRTPSIGRIFATL